jgi:hypothetical protein
MTFDRSKLKSAKGETEAAAWATQIAIALTVKEQGPFGAIRDFRSVWFAIVLRVGKCLSL